MSTATSIIVLGVSPRLSTITWQSDEVYVRGGIACWSSLGCELDNKLHLASADITHVKNNETFIVEL